MFSIGSKSYLSGVGITAGVEKTVIVYFDIRVDSPYKDLVLIQGSPLESNPVPLSGRLVFSLSQDIVVKRISLKLVGRFKLDFLQMGRGRNSNGVASIVRDQSTILETRWDNLLTSPEGKVSVGNDDDRRSGQTQTVSVTKRSLSSPVVNRLMKKKSHSAHILELPADGFCGTPYKELDLTTLSSSFLFHLPKGNYELPFKVMLPSEIPETIEGLQSGSILYNFEAHIDRKKKASSVTSMIRDDVDTISTAVTGTPHQHYHSYTIYKYLRILRTLSVDNLALQEEMSVGDTCTDKIQYEISLPSRAIPIGGVTPINIQLFPFRKGYMLERVNASLIQYYAMKDSSGQVYDDQMVIMKQSMTEFGNMIENADNLLTDKTSITSMFKLPDNLKRITQDCELRDELIRVKHKLSIQIILKCKSETNAKNLEIKANLPILLYVSPQVKMKGRLVLFDNSNGAIHFRPGELVDLFGRPDGEGTSSSSSSSSFLPFTANREISLQETFANQFKNESLPPPNYQDRLKDCLIRNSIPSQTTTQSAPASPTHYTRSLPTDDYLTVIPNTYAHADANALGNMNEVPTYEQSMQYNSSSNSVTPRDDCTELPPPPPPM